MQVFQFFRPYPPNLAWAHGMATSVHGQTDPSAEAGGIAGQEGNGRSHLLDIPRTTQGMGSLRVLKELLVRLRVHPSAGVQVGHRHAGA